VEDLASVSQVKQPISLIEPNPALLASYAEALARGWSFEARQETRLEQLAAMRHDPQSFLRDLLSSNGTMTLPDGRVVPRLPSKLFWITDDDGFCGQIAFRFQPSTEALPDYVWGHIGYAVVPWKRRRGYATEALRLILPLAKKQGLKRVLINCDDDNEASQKVILANGGVLTGGESHQYRPGRRKLSYWIDLSR